MKKSRLSKILSFMLLIALTLLFSVTAFAAGPEAAEEAAAAADPVSAKAIAAAIVVGIATAAGAIGMSLAIKKSAESMARQPEASDKINSAMMLGLVFIETLAIYALIVAILIIFVL